MIVLALEFSAPRRSAAIVELDGQDRRLLGEANDAGARDLKPLELVQNALDDAGVDRTRVECVAVGLGPGSYTGIRSAIAVAQGWQLAHDVELIGASSVETLAVQAQAQGWLGVVYIVIDAQRNELYVAVYDVGETVRNIEPLQLRTVEQVRQRVSGGETGLFVGTHKPSVVGPEVDRWFEEGRLLIPEAAQLGRLVAGRTDSVAGEKMEPIYLRETQFVKAPPPRIIS